MLKADIPDIYNFFHGHFLGCVFSKSDRPKTAITASSCSSVQYTPQDCTIGREGSHTHTHMEPVPWAGTLSWVLQEVRGCRWGPRHCALRWGWQGAPGSKRADGSGFPAHRSILSKYLKSETGLLKVPRVIFGLIWDFYIAKSLT